MELEFKSWLCIHEHEYFNLLKATLFEKIADHSLIYDHDLFVCQELINSEILLINLAVLKLFIEDINSFSIEEWKRLGLQQNSSHALNDEEKVIGHITMQ